MIIIMKNSYIIRPVKLYGSDTRPLGKTDENK